jgi:hypothetical protein
MQSHGKADHHDRGGPMNPGIVLATEKMADPAAGMAETPKSLGDVKRTRQGFSRFEISCRHSIVPGGFEVLSWMTRSMPRTSFDDADGDAAQARGIAQRSCRRRRPSREILDTQAWFRDRLLLYHVVLMPAYAKEIADGLHRDPVRHFARRW